MLFGFIVRLFKSCLTKTLMKHFCDYQNNFKAVFLGTYSRAFLIALTVSYFCSASDLSSTLMKWVSDSALRPFSLQEKFSTRIKRLKKDRNSTFSCFMMERFGCHEVFPKLQTMFVPKQEDPKYQYMESIKHCLKQHGFLAQHHRIKQRQRDSIGYIRIIEVEWQACRSVRNI